MLASGRHDRRVGLDADMLDVKICRHGYGHGCLTARHTGVPKGAGGPSNSREALGSAVNGHPFAERKWLLIIGCEIGPNCAQQREKKDGMVQALWPFVDQAAFWPDFGRGDVDMYLCAFTSRDELPFTRSSLHFLLWCVVRSLHFWGFRRADRSRTMLGSSSKLFL